VVGFDDIPLAELAYPPLTTMRQPLATMAALAFDQLRAGIEDGPASPRLESIRTGPSSSCAPRPRLQLGQATTRTVNAASAEPFGPTTRSCAV